MVIPWNDRRELTTDELETVPGLSTWWNAAEQLWRTNGTSSMTLAEQINYQGKLTKQLPASPRRVIYVKSGESGVAARLRPVAWWESAV